ncbi:MAG: YggT family protein [Nitrospirae bacterium]|nr:YggT family protein [Nitrospirota bacterium]
MFVAANFLTTVAWLLDKVLDLYSWAFIIAALLSWVNPDPYNPIVRFLRSVTEPVLYRIRRVLNISAYGGIDFSPIIAILGIQFIRMFFIKTLFDIAGQM